VKKSRNSFFIYSPKYKNINSATTVLRKIKRYFPSAYVLNNKVNIINAGKTKEVIIVKENNTYKIVDNKNNDLSKYFVNIAFGSASMSVTTELTTAIEDSAMSYALEGGYIYNENIFFTLGYLNSSTSDADMNSLYVSSNYLYKVTEDIGIYTGLLLGYGTLKLNVFTESKASSSTMIGVQVGTKYNVYDNIDIYAGYQLFMQDHIVEVINEANTISPIEYGMLHNIQLGVSYRF